jgi:uncharacterized glyoxalase superfamily protein PhnB
MASAGPDIIPALCYRDARAAIDWLEKAFGFTRIAVHDGPDGSIAHAELKHGNGAIMLGSVRDNELGMAPPDNGKVTQVTYIVVDDPDMHFARAQAAGAEILRPLADTDYGSREYCARDLEGNVWSFGTYRPKL